MESIRAELNVITGQPMYEQQYHDAKKAGETDETLSQIYLGVCSQSNWDKKLDHGLNGKSLFSKIFRIIKRRILRRLV